MSQVYIVYWSGTGNTAAMADFVAEGVKAGGAEAVVLPVSAASVSDLANAKAFALGCPSMGAEQLEESEMEPFVMAVETFAKGKKIALFGSYGWGDGQWMRDWEERCQAAGAELAADSVIANDAPGDEEAEQCRNLGAALA